MFIDELTLKISAGKGGDGIVSWMHEKGIDHAGPGGGDGGRGGNVYIKGVRDIGRLAEYKFIKEISAEDGESGLSNKMHGRSGEDIVIEVPIGSVVKNLETSEEIDILSEEPVFFLKGGNGGFGNDHFKGPTNRRPKECTPGKPGQSGEFLIELKLVVDLGLVGLPNAGKSSLLNVLTNARAKVGNYKFTTLAPNLGDLYGFVIADIPGLIEGASEGKGLGHKFLRHVSRTKMILHCISSENEDVVSAYKTIREELGRYDETMLEKPEIILLTKIDVAEPDSLQGKIEALRSINKDIYIVSIIDDESVKQLSDNLVKKMRGM